MPSCKCGSFAMFSAEIRVHPFVGSALKRRDGICLIAFVNIFAMPCECSTCVYRYHCYKFNMCFLSIDNVLYPYLVWCLVCHKSPRIAPVSMRLLEVFWQTWCIFWSDTLTEEIFGIRWTRHCHERLLLHRENSINLASVFALLPTLSERHTQSAHIATTLILYDLGCLARNALNATKVSTRKTTLCAWRTRYSTWSVSDALPVLNNFYAATSLRYVRMDYFVKKIILSLRMLESHTRRNNIAPLH